MSLKYIESKLQIDTITNKSNNNEEKKVTFLPFPPPLIHPSQMVI